MKGSLGGEKETYLNDGLPSGDFQDLTLSGLSISELHVDNLRVPASNQREGLVNRSVSWGRGACRHTVQQSEYSPGELDVVEDNEGTFDIEDGTVVDAGRDVVVTGRGTSINDVVCHFTRIVCCFSCKLLKSASVRQAERRF